MHPCVTTDGARSAAARVHFSDITPTKAIRASQPASPQSVHQLSNMISPAHSNDIHQTSTVSASNTAPVIANTTASSFSFKVHLKYSDASLSSDPIHAATVATSVTAAPAISGVLDADTSAVASTAPRPAPSGKRAKTVSFSPGRYRLRRSPVFRTTRRMPVIVGARTISTSDIRAAYIDILNSQLYQSLPSACVMNLQQSSTDTSLREGSHETSSTLVDSHTAPTVTHQTQLPMVDVAGSVNTDHIQYSSSPAADPPSRLWHTEAADGSASWSYPYLKPGCTVYVPWAAFKESRSPIWRDYQNYVVKGKYINEITVCFPALGLFQPTSPAWYRPIAMGPILDQETYDATSEFSLTVFLASVPKSSVAATGPNIPAFTAYSSEPSVSAGVHQTYFASSVTTVTTAPVVRTTTAPPRQNIETLPNVATSVAPANLANASVTVSSILPAADASSVSVTTPVAPAVLPTAVSHTALTSKRKLAATSIVRVMANVESSSRSLVVAIIHLATKVPLCQSSQFIESLLRSIKDEFAPIASVRRALAAAVKVTTTMEQGVLPAATIAAIATNTLTPSEAIDAALMTNILTNRYPPIVIAASTAPPSSPTIQGTLTVSTATCVISNIDTPNTSFPLVFPTPHCSESISTLPRVISNTFRPLSRPKCHYSYSTFHPACAVSNSVIPNTSIPLVFPTHHCSESISPVSCVISNSVIPNTSCNRAPKRHYSYSTFHPACAVSNSVIPNTSLPLVFPTPHCSESISPLSRVISNSVIPNTFCPPSQPKRHYSYSTFHPAFAISNLVATFFIRVVLYITIEVARVAGDIISTFQRSGHPPPEAWLSHVT